MQEALAEQPARADRDLRLQDVIAGAERIALGIEEGVGCGSSDSRAGSARRPARPQPPRRPAPGRTSTAARRRGRTSPPPPSTSIIAVPRSGCFSTSAAGSRTSSAGTTRRSGRPISSTVQAVEIARERQHQRDLHELRRLELDDAEIDPALRAHADRAAHLDRDQQQQRARRRSSRPSAARSGDRPAPTPSMITTRDARSGSTCLLGPGLPAAVGGGIEHGEADRTRSQIRSSEQAPIEAQQLLARRSARGGRSREVECATPAQPCARVAGGAEGLIAARDAPGRASAPRAARRARSAPRPRRPRRRSRRHARPRRRRHSAARSTGAKAMKSAWSRSFHGTLVPVTMAVLALGLADVVDLRRAGLARHRHRRDRRCARCRRCRATR